MPIFQEAAVPNVHLNRSLHLALTHFRGKGLRSLVVLEEGQIFSLDLLWFFVQLLPVIRRDSSILCASAWNENGLAPYAADLTVLLRSDGFSSTAWLMEMDVLKALLPQWAKERASWRDWLLEQLRKSKKQCLVPEVSRVASATADCLRPELRPGPDAQALVEALRRQNAPVTASPSTCSGDEVQLERQSMRSVISGQLRSFLGDVMRMEASSFEDWFLWRWPGRQGMFYSQPLASVAELDAYLGYQPAFEEPEHARQVLSHAPLRLVLAAKATERGSWPHIAQHFGLSTDRPKGSYQGVIRLWWRNRLLYLVVDPNSPLLWSTERYQSSWRLGSGAPSPKLSGAHFAEHAKDPQLPAHRPIPPGAVLSAAPLGESCSRHCEAQGHVCVDGDLIAVAACAPPLTLSFGCNICEEEAASAAFPGLHRDTGRCGAGQKAPGAPQSSMMAADCSASAPRVRRFCVCRVALVQSPLLGKTHLRLRSPGLHFAHEMKKSNVDVASADRLEAFRTAMIKARPDALAKLNLFAEQNSLPEAPMLEYSNGNGIEHKEQNGHKTFPCTKAT
ncbi:unnamed protein product [Durusdinium trenchii]|uniref:alpha-1,3-mannosyl-glycoprotein 2-beta-N-acetylglucosaminyltransferase n=1 Tax=Durusdinium trenchii TaxID=1381693 RepID=A0ABP0LJ46_9DINO